MANTKEYNPICRCTHYHTQHQHIVSPNYSAGKCTQPGCACIGFVIDASIKVAGIVCDNYKVEKYKSVLQEKGFKDYEVVPYIENTSVVKVKIKDSQANDIKKICQFVELHFKRSN